MEQKIIITQRELDILTLVFGGYRSIEIAKQLFISRHTVDTRLGLLRAKFGARTTEQLVLHYIRAVVRDQVELKR